MIKDATPNRKRIARDAVWVFSGQALSVVAVLVGLRVITGAVSPAVFGSVALAIGVVALAQGLAIAPMMQAVLRFYPDYPGNSGETVLRRTAIGALRAPVLILSVALALAIGIWSSVMHVGLALGLMCAALFVINSIRTVETSFLSAARKQRSMSLLAVADAWLEPLCALVALQVFGARADVVVGGYALGSLLSLLGFYALTRTRAVDDAGDSLAPDEQSVATQSRLWTYARPLMILPLIGWVSGQADRYIIGGLIGLQFAGLYAATYALASRPFLMLGSGVELVLRQIYYTEVSAGNDARRRKVFVFWLGAVLSIALALLAFIAVLHRQITAVLLAPEYRSYSALMIPIAGGYVLAVCSQVVERICYALHDTRGVMLIQVAGAVLSVAIAVPMVLVFGVRGAALSVPLYFGGQLCVAIWRARRASRLSNAQMKPRDNRESV